MLLFLHTLLVQTRMLVHTNVRQAQTIKGSCKCVSLNNMREVSPLRLGIVYIALTIHVMGCPGYIHCWTHWQEIQCSLPVLCSLCFLK